MKLSDAVRAIANRDPYWVSGSKRVQADALLRQIAKEHDDLSAECRDYEILQEERDTLLAESRVMREFLRRFRSQISPSDQLTLHADVKEWMDQNPVSTERCWAAQMIKDGKSSYPLEEHARDCDICSADNERKQPQKPVRRPDLYPK